MPKYRVTVEKFFSQWAEYWTNVYWIIAADTAAADVQAQALADAERPLYPVTVTITKWRRDDGVPNTDVYRTNVLNVAGSRTGMTTDILAFFMTGRVDFSSADGGRPSRKYIRGTLEEGEVSGITLGAAAITRLNTYANAALAAGICDPQGNDLVGASTFAAPQMRQLRRGSKKKVTP